MRSFFDRFSHKPATIMLISSSFGRQHRPYPKEGAWHRLRHFTLAALRLPGDAMNLNYNPGFPHSSAPYFNSNSAQSGTQYHRQQLHRNPKAPAVTFLMVLATTSATWCVICLWSRSRPWLLWRRFKSLSGLSAAVVGSRKQLVPSRTFAEADR